MRMPIALGILAAAVLSVTLAACSQVNGSADTRTTGLSDKKLAPFSSMYQVDRLRFGLEQILASAEVDIERRVGQDAKTAGYDAMLHIRQDSLSKTVVFAWNGSAYDRIGEQDVHTGPHEFDTVDGKQQEHFTVTYHLRAIGTSAPGLRIDYFGEDKRLLNKKLTLSDIRPVLAEWNAEAERNKQAK